LVKNSIKTPPINVVGVIRSGRSASAVGYLGAVFSSLPGTFFLFLIKKNYMTLALRTRSLFYQSKSYAFSTKCLRPIDVKAFSTLRAPTKSDRSYSTDSSGLAVFSDADKDKLNILKYVKGKSGIYL